MRDAPTTQKHGWLSDEIDGDRPDREGIALAVAWSLAEPARAGEVAFVADDDGARLLGRGAAQAGDPAPRLAFLRRRPGAVEAPRPLGGQGLSRRQLLIRADGGALAVTRTGRSAVLVNGAPVDAGSLRPGDTLLVEGELLLLCVARPERIPPLLHARGDRLHPFGEADPHGIVGESPAIWALRDRLAFVGPRDPHVLVLGESGVGKELVARAIHALSPRGRRPMISRNAATLPPGLVDAELFGNAKSYPNPGLAERPGLLGEAHGSTLFLDEIGEMPPELTAHLLRVLDRGGEYQRLGEAAVRTADVRLVAATNRPASALKHDFLARLALSLEVPGLAARREDIPLIARHMLRRLASEDTAIGARFFERGTGEPRIAPALVEALLRHRFTRHVRELSSLLWKAIASSRGHYIDLTSEVGAELALEEPREPPARSLPLGPAEIQACLDRCGGSVSRAYRELGLSSRDALYRLIKKHGLSVRREGAGGD